MSPFGSHTLCEKTKRYGVDDRCSKNKLLPTGLGAPKFFVF